MPLIKKYCKKCINISLFWSDVDEEWWEKRGLVECPGAYIEETMYRKTNEPPPVKCPFLLEYILINQGNK